MKPRMQADIEHGLSHDETTIWAEDLDGTRSITNDAEAVVEFLVEQYGNRPIIYRDTTGRWDQLCHRDGTFTHFGPIGARTGTEALNHIAKTRKAS